MNNAAFDSSQVCAIIEACGKAGVGKFSYAGLELGFGRPADPQEILTPPSKDLLVEQTKANEKAHMERQIREKEDELANLYVENPVKAEELLITEDLYEEQDDLEESE